MRLEWLPAALADRDTIYDYIKADSRRAAIHVDEIIELQADRLIDHPYRGRIGRMPKRASWSFSVRRTLWFTRSEQITCGFCVFFTRHNPVPSNRTTTDPSPSFVA